LKRVPTSPVVPGQALAESQGRKPPGTYPSLKMLSLMILTVYVQIETVVLTEEENKQFSIRINKTKNTEQKPTRASEGM
jgi:hypothetical protein